MAQLITNINVLSELERCGVKYEWAGDSEVKTVCPFHDDHSPTCSINVEKRLFQCHAAGCMAHGDFMSFLVGLLKASREVILKDLGSRYDLTDTKSINADTVERYHAAIWDAGPLLKELYNRGVTNDIIRLRRLGEFNGRITIPIQNEGGLFVNIRKYLPGAPGKEKMRNAKGFGKIRLYPVDQLKYKKIVLCGGEVKAIVAAAELNQYGIGAITATGGEGNWDASLTPAFADKEVWICLDVDPEGQAAAKERCRTLYKTVSAVYNLVLPLDIDKYPHGDINDWIGLEHKELYPLLEECEEWEPEAYKTLEDVEPEEVSLTTAVHAACTGKRISVSTVVSAMDTSPYVIPSKVCVQCDKSQKMLCGICPVFVEDEDKLYDIHPESQALMEMVSAHRNAQREALMRSLGIPDSCPVANFQVHDYFNVEDVRVSPQLEITNRSAERVMQPALCIGKGLELNESYNLVGRMYPHPKTQQSTLLISKYKPTADALSSYVAHELGRLRVFQPSDWELGALSSRLSSIYEDLEANVTRIYMRRDLHLFIDLAYHSPLLLNFDGKREKGWVEVLILGDSAQGKSEATKCLQEHYGLGEKVECKNATVAGLLGGLQQMGSRWFVTWGVIPTHDKRLVILEEVKGARVEVIGKLTDMRSSGIAEIPKIEKRRTHARTRLIFVSNPRSEHPLASYNYGIEAIKELIGSPEDVRRFDACLILASSEIDSQTLNNLQLYRPQVEHTYTSELCRALILWTWTRRDDQVLFDKDAYALVMEEATKLSEEFTDAIPILDRGSTRFKIARLAAALAARVFSCSEDMESIRVRLCHVEFIAKRLRECYTSSAFGYADYTAAVDLTRELIDPADVKGKINAVPFPRDFVKQALHTTNIEINDLQDWCAWDRHDAQDLLSFLVRKHALIRDGRAYRKSPPFIKFLKGLLENGQLIDRPAHVKDSKEEF